MADGGIARLRKIADYPALLNEAWLQAQAPRAPNAPTVISTFAGCGGSSLGYHMAGFRELLAVEWEQNAADTFRMNFPHVPLYHGDIAKLSVDECLRLAGVAPGELDVFDGSPPCQGFSTAGKREMGDQRNQLFREYVRLLRGLQPRAFVMENVSGMVKGDFKLIFAEILRALKGCGYRVKARLLNAMFFGVPQSRERMIFIGLREDLQREPSHPMGWSEPFGPAIDGSADSSLYLSASQFSAIEQHKARQSAKGNGFGWQEVSSARPSHAIVKNMMIGGANTRLVRDGQRWRYLSDVEIKDIGSFPQAFAFSGREAMIERIGNSVPPLLMRSVALHVRGLLAR